MSFTALQTGIETCDESLQVLFPHPPIIRDRFAESAAGVQTAVGITGAVCAVIWPLPQARRRLSLTVRKMTPAQMAALVAVRDAGAIVRVKTSAASVDTVLCVFDGEQRWGSMIADHPESKPDGTAVPDIFTVYEAEIDLWRLE